MEIFSSDPNLVGITEFNPRKRKDNNVACKNMNLQLNKHAHVLLGKSPIAGWGAFFGVDVKKDDFLGEYAMQMITHSEAERRGSQYDQTNSSFLFNLNDNWVLDAYSRGNKFKFANHSKNPNCYPLVIYARWNHRDRHLRESRFQIWRRNILRLRVYKRYHRGSFAVGARRRSGRRRDLSKIIIRTVQQKS